MLVDVVDTIEIFPRERVRAVLSRSHSALQVGNGQFVKLECRRRKVR